jgi:hypothetical protein
VAITCCAITPCVIDQVLDEELPRYAEALERLGQ